MKRFSFYSTAYLNISRSQKRPTYSSDKMQLDEWMMELKQVAKSALAGSPQQLEALQFGAVA